MPLLADGAMGTELRARSSFAGLPSRLNLTHPELVLALHREYLAAGAQLIVANTLGGTAEEIRAGIDLARQAAGEKGSGESMVAASLASPDQLPAADVADAVIFETLTSVSPLEAASRRCDKPLLATFSFGQDGRLGDLAPRELAGVAQRLGLYAWGYGCGYGPAHATMVLADLRQAAPEAVLIGKPNLGLPHEGTYAITPGMLATWASNMARLGVQIVGACCGSTPAHVRAMASTLVDSKAVNGGEL